MKLNIKKDATSQTVYLFIQDSSVTTGAGKTGLVFNTASLVAYYVRPLGSAVAITLATQTVTGAYSSGGFVEVDATNMPGIYRLDLPNAVVATGVNSVVVMLKGAANMAPVTLEIQLVSYDPNDSAALGLTLVPANVTQLGGVAQSLTDLKAFADSGYDPATNKVQGVVLVDTITTYTGNTPQTGDSFVRLPAALVGGRMDSSVGAMASAVLTSSAVAAGALNNSAFASDTSIKNIRSSTCQAGATSTTVVLDASASALDNFYRHCKVVIRSGTGLGQSRLIISYVGATKTATIEDAWIVTPAAGDTFVIVEWEVLENVTSVTGAVGSVTGAVGSVTGAVGSVTGAVGSVTGNVGGNVVGSVASVTGAVGSVTGAVGSVTGNVGGNVVGSVASVTGAVGSVAAGGITDASIATGAINAAALAADVVNDIWMGTALTEAYAADATAATPAQLLYMIYSTVMEFSISGTTLTCKKLDGTTTAMTVTLDSATAPTSRTRAT